MLVWCFVIEDDDDDDLSEHKHKHNEESSATEEDEIQFLEKPKDRIEKEHLIEKGKKFLENFYQEYQ